MYGGVAATTVTATGDVDTDVTITPPDSHDFQPGHQVPLEPGNNFIEILVTKPGHIDVPYTVEIHREPLVIPRITRVRVISRPLNQNTNVYRNDEPVEFEFTFDHPVVVDLTGGRPTLAVDIWLNDSPQGPTDFPYARGSGTNALVFQLLNDEAGLLETAVGFGLSANSINVPEGSSITHSPGGGNANLNHRALHRISNQYLDDRRNSRLAALDQVHLTNVTLDQQFRSRKTLYTATPDHGATVTTVTVTPKDGVSYTIMPEDADDVADGHQVTLHHGTNEIVLTATKEGAATMTYTIAVVAPITPRIESIEVISQPTDGETYVIGDIIEIAVTFDLPILVDTDNGTPNIRVQFGSDEQPIDYSETADDSRTIIFSHTVDQSLTDNDGISIPENPLNENGGIITYLRSGTRAALRHSGLPDQTQHRVNPDAMIVENGVQITSDPAADDTYGPAETITFTVEFDTPVTVKTSEGTPYLQFTMGNDARRAGYTSISPDNRILTFAYTIAVGDEDDDGISMTANALILDGGAITGNVSANDADLEHPAPGTGGLFSGHKVDATTTAPVIAGVALTSDAGTDRTYATGDAITVALTYNQAVEIDTTDGTPSLAVTIGDDARAATYAEINSAKTVLTFSYTVVSEDSDQDGVSIAANSLTLNSGSITADEDDADALLIHVALPTQAGHLVNKIPLIVTDGVQITSTPASGDTYQAGETVTFTVTFDSDVAVDTTDGTPALAITLVNANRQAAYTGIDATKRILTFAYTVATEDLDEDGLSVPANAIDLNSGTITHTTTGKEADLSHEPPGTSGSFPNHRADGSPVTPAIAADGITISSTPIAETDTYGLDETIVVSMAFTAPVVVDTTDGTPSLSVRIGNADARSRDREAKYQRGSGSSTLQFEWKVLANDRDNNGIRILADSLELNGGTIRNTTNLTDALLTHPLPGSNGIFADHKVDGRLMPAFASLSALSFSGATLSPTFEPTTVSYIAMFPADAVSTTVTATAESGATITIEPADSDTETDGHQVDLTEAPDEITVSVSKADSADRVYRVNIALTSATITDLATINALAIISDPGSDGTYATGDAITVAVTYDQAVDVDATDGTPSLAVTIGDNARAASYTGHNEAKTTIAFSYTVVSEDSDQDGISIAANSLALNNGAITADDDDADASLAHAALETQTGHLVNKTPLIVANGVQITSTPSSGDTYQAGETVTFTVTFDSDVAVDTTDGTPALAITLGSANRQAAYTGIDATQRILTFSYTVASGDLDEDGLSVPVNAIDLNSGTITHTTTSKDADLDHPLPGTNGLFPGHKVNAVTVAPAIADGGVTITSMPLAAADTYGRNEIIVISVAFTSPVVVNTADGTPTMTFKVGNAGRLAATRKAEYQRGSGSSTLQFEWRVPQGSRDNNGIRIRGNALQLNGGTIRDAATGLDALLTHPDPVSEITFGNHKLDGKLLADFTNLSDLSLSGGTLAPDFGPTVLRYTATFPADATSTTVTATAPSDHTVTIQPADSDTEATGHQVDLTQEPEEVVVTVTTASAATYTYRVKIVVSSPEITALDITSDPGADGTYAAGDVITVAATYNVPVTVDTTDGTPSLALTVGDNARDAGYTETGALGRKITFSYTVVSDDSDQDGISIAANSLALNSGTIRNAGDTMDASPDHTALDTQTGHVVNKIPLIVAGGVQITSTPASGDTYQLDETITFTVTFDANVDVDTTDGTPYLVINLGNASRQAAYTGIDATKRILTFSYTVAADDMDEDGLSVPANALALNGGTIKHTTTGKDAGLSHGLPGASGSFPNHRADGDPDVPAITSVTLSSDAGTDNTYATGDAITVAVTYSEAVAVDTTSGTPSLTLTVGSNARSAGYTTIDSAATTLTFSYTVVSDDSDQDGISIAADSLALNSGTIRNKADTIDASLSHAALPAQAVNLVNKIPLIIANGIDITSAPSNGDTYRPDETISFGVTFDSDVAIDTTDGTPTLALTVGTTAKSAAYAAVDVTNRILTFSYTVADDDLDDDGLSVPANAIALNNGTIKHTTTGKDADLSHPLPGTNGVFTGHSVNASSATNGTDAPAATVLVANFNSPRESSLKIDSSNSGIGQVFRTGSGRGYRLESVTAITRNGRSADTITLEASVHHLTNNQRGAKLTTLTHTSPVADLTMPVFTDPNNIELEPSTAYMFVIRCTSGCVNNAHARFSMARDDQEDPGTVAGWTIENWHTRASSNWVNIGFGQPQELHISVQGTANHPYIINNGLQIVSTPATDGPYGNGETIRASLTFNHSVTVDATDGNPRIAFTMGDTVNPDQTAYLDYTDGSGTATLYFEYTVQPGDHDTDGIEIDSSALELNGGAITDAESELTAILRLPAQTTLASTTIDGGTIPDPGQPAVTAVALTSNPGTDQTYATGDTITATVTYDEAVAVDTTDGTPGLTLTIGDNARNAGYTSIDSSETVLTFSYTVVADDSDQDGISIAADSLALNSGTIRNKADTADASLGHTILLAQADHLVNKIPLIVTGGVQITSNPASGDTYLVGETITFTATFDAPVTVTTAGGFPLLAFTLGSASKTATYNSTSANGETLGFSYTVVAGDLDTDGVSVAANALSLNSGTIKHTTTGRDADLSHPLPGTSGLFAGHKVDAIPDAPTITSVTLTSNAGTDNTYATFDAITAAVTYSEAIVVDTTDGTPSLALTIGDTARSAGYTSIDSSETVLTFSYTVISDDSDQDGIAIAANSLALNAGTIRNKADTVDASLTHAALATQTGHLVNKIPLIITDGVDITSSPASGNPYAPGEAITFGVTFDSDVIVDTTNGTPTLALTVGSTAKQATYTTIDATNRILTFSYAVVSGDLDEDGVSVAANALALNNGAIKHFTTGRDADLSHPLPGTNGVFPQHQVGRRDITALSISSDPGIHATYATGDTITVAMTFAEQVTVDTTGGTPYLPLTIGSMTRNAAYTSTDSSGLVLTFSYTIVAEDRDNNGPSIAANSLTLDGGTIRYAGTANDVSLAHRALPNQTGHRINRAPAIVNNGVDVTSSPLGDETYGLNETITISVTFNSVVVVDTTNGTPRVDVLFAAYHNDDDDRARFRYARGSGTKTLEFDYTVQSGDRDSNGIFISLNQLFLDGGTITHITTGRNANLRHGPAGDSGTLAEHKVDGSVINIPRPRISSIEFGTDPSRLQTYITGSTINVIVTFDEEVNIDETNGTPTIALTIGAAVRNAAYVGSISGTIDMHFYYTVVAEDSDQDGVSIAANAISLNGATIRNSDDTVDASLAHAALPDNPAHVVNKIPLIVTGGLQIASTPSSDDTYGQNEIITFIVAFDSDVTVDVIDGSPYLEFTIGDNLRTAAYDASSSSDRSLVFSYTVVQADSDDDGVSMAANAVNLDGASITHSQIGTDADLTHPAPGIFAGHKVDGSTIAAIRPVITGLAISSDPGADRTYAAGDVITATVTFDQPVTVTFETASGELWLPLTIGESQREAHYSSTDASGHVLTFAYTVVEQDSDPDGVSIPRNSISGQSVSVDLSGHTLHANLFHLELDDQPDHRVNAAPRIINRGVRIESSPRSGDTYRIGETISFSVTFDASVVVDTTKGTPHMRLRVDDSPGADNAPYLRYSSGSGSRTLYFSWTIPQRTRDHSGIYMGANQLHAGRGSIRHASTGRDAILEHQRPGRLDGEFPDHKILPRHYRYITNLALASDAGDDRTYRTGDVITATVRFNDDIDLNTAGGSPFFRLIIGETLRLAQYSAQDSTSDTLHFHYTVVAEDRDDDGVYMRSNGLQLNGSVITAAGETDEAFVKHPWVEDQHRHRVNTP